MPEFYVTTTRQYVSGITVTGESEEDVQQRLDDGEFDDQFADAVQDYSEYVGDEYNIRPVT